MIKAEDTTYRQMIRKLTFPLNNLQATQKNRFPTLKLK